MRYLPATFVLCVAVLTQGCDSAPAAGVDTLDPDMIEIVSVKAIPRPDGEFLAYRIQARNKGDVTFASARIDFEFKGTGNTNIGTGSIAYAMGLSPDETFDGVVPLNPGYTYDNARCYNYRTVVTAEQPTRIGKKVYEGTCQ